MKYTFSFNYLDYDLWEVYETIKKYYPIGLEKVENEPYYEYPGIKELEKLVVENLHNEGNYQDRFVKFCDKLELESEKEIEGTTYGQAPSFSAALQISKVQTGNCVYTKELYFGISILGKYYQIYGRDSTMILETDEVRVYHSTNVITPSPFKEYKEPFLFIESKIRERYPGYKIIPYMFGRKIIKGLQVRYIDDEECTVDNALFNQFLNDHRLLRTRGGRNYGMEQWKKK